MKKIQILLCSLLLLTAIGQPAPAQQHDRFPELEDIPEMTVDMPEVPRPWDMDTSVLRDSIAAHGGRAFIGLKAPQNPRMAQANGLRRALSAQEFRAGLEMLDARGIEILHIYRSFGAVHVRMRPEE